MSEIEEVEKVEEEKKPKDLKVCSSSFHFVATLLVTFFITCCYFVSLRSLIGHTIVGLRGTSPTAKYGTYDIQDDKVPGRPPIILDYSFWSRLL